MGPIFKMVLQGILCSDCTDACPQFWTSWLLHEITGILNIWDLVRIFGRFLGDLQAMEQDQYGCSLAPYIHPWKWTNHPIDMRNISFQTSIFWVPCEFPGYIQAPFLSALCFCCKFSPNEICWEGKPDEPQKEVFISWNPARLVVIPISG